jgi:hypothetical protein
MPEPRGSIQHRADQGTSNLPPFRLSHTLKLAWHAQVLIAAKRTFRLDQAVQIQCANAASKCLY